MYQDNEILMLAGLVITAIFGVMTASKMMRDNKVLAISLLISFTVAITQLVLSWQGGYIALASRSDSLYSPLVYVIIYNLFRIVYIRIYDREPTYNRASWYDPQDGRKQNWFDVLVYVAPLFISLGFPVLLSVIKSKL